MALRNTASDHRISRNTGLIQVLDKGMELAAVDGCGRVTAQVAYTDNKGMPASAIWNELDKAICPALSLMMMNMIMITSCISFS